MITILVLKFVLILPVFYYYVTLFFFFFFYYVTFLYFFLLSTYFWLTLYFNGFSQKANFFLIRRDKESSWESPKSMAKSAKAFLRQL